MSDPVAEFLAREDGALDDDIDIGQEPAAPPVQVENVDIPIQNGIHRGEGGDSGVDLAAADSVDNYPSAPLSNGHTNRPSSVSSSSTATREEHETIKKWREDHAKLIKEKDEAELKQKKSMQESAKAELKAWKEKHKAEIAERKKKNREIEKTLQKEAGAAPKKSGDGWSEVAKLVDSVNPKLVAKNVPDRMKSLICERQGGVA